MAVKKVRATKSVEASKKEDCCASSSTKSRQISQEELQGLISKKAKELWEKRGRVDGRSLDNWLEAERIVKSSLKCCK